MEAMVPTGIDLLGFDKSPDMATPAVKPVTAGKKTLNKSSKEDSSDAAVNNTWPFSTAPEVKKPSVIVTTAGMLQGGPVYSYLPELYKDKNSSLLLTGYQVENTPGRTLLETGKIGLEGLMVNVKMNVKKFDFSAHAGRTELFSTVNKLNPEKVFCVHGDEKVALKFAKDLKKDGFDAVAPKVGERIKV